MARLRETLFSHERRASRKTQVVTLALLAVLLAVVVRSCGGSDGDASPGAGPVAKCNPSNATAVDTIEIGSKGFKKSCVKVPLNKIITVRNTDPAQQHTVTAKPPNVEQFDVTVAPNGGEWRHAFAAKGTINIICRLHDNEAIAVIVE